jgi:acetyl-CoA acetyltransferase
VTEFLEKRAAITGIGVSAVGRPLDRSGLALTLDACLQAIEGAGLRPSDVDGLASWPGVPENTPGMSPVGLIEVKESLGLELNWFTAGGEAPSQISSVINAAAAVACGYARHVLCFRTVKEASSQTKGRRASVSGSGGGRIRGDFQFQIPFKAMSAAQWIAMFAQRHFHEYGTTKEQLGWIALNARRNAALNPRAIFRDPLRMDDYLNARIISTPFGLYDCDIPCDGSTAVLVSRAEEARDLRKPVLCIEAIGCAVHGRYSWDQFDDLTTMPARDSAAMLWNRTDLRPSHVDVAELYDGFSFITMAWLEALGFCGKGEAGPFVDGGKRIALDGELPLNTQGGQLSGGRLHGMGYLHEACTQLWGEGAERQVPGEPKVAAVGVGGGPVAGCMLLRRD